MAPAAKGLKTMDHLLERVMKRLEKIESNLDIGDSDFDDAAEMFAMENEHDKAEAELIDVLCDRVARLEKEAHKLDVNSIAEHVESRVQLRMSVSAASSGDRPGSSSAEDLPARSQTPGKGGHFDAQGGADLHGRALPSFESLVGDGRTLHCLENELRYLSKRIDNNMEEDGDRQVQQDTRDKQQDELMRMEFLRMTREIASRPSSDDIKKLKHALTNKVDALLDDASELVRERVGDAKADIMLDIDSFVGSIKSIGEKNMDATAALETRCVKLESRLNDMAHALEDSKNDQTQLRLRLEAGDEASNRLFGELAVRLADSEASVARLTEEVSDGFGARLVACEARLDDDLPVGQGARVERRLDAFAASNASRKDLEDLDVATQREMQTFREATDAKARALDQKRAAKDVDAAAALTELSVACQRHAKALAETRTKQATFEQHVAAHKKEKAEAKVAKATEKLEAHFEEYRAEQTAQHGEATRRIEAERARSDAERSRLAIQIYKQCDALGARIEEAKTAASGDLETASASLSDRIGRVDEVAKRTVTTSEACAERVDACERDVQAGNARALQLVDEARRGLFADLKLATDEFQITKRRTEVEVERLTNVMLTQTKDYTEAMARLHRSLIAQAIAVKAVQRQCSAVALKDSIGDGLDAVLDEHVKQLSRHCVEAEAAVTTPRPMSLPYHEQRFLAATVQQCAEKLAARADFECLRRVVGHAEPETNDAWDDQLEANRGALLERFVNEIGDACKKLHPTQDALAKATRHQFVTRLELCIKIGMSKHSAVQTNQTLFGKVKLGPACVACDRPFGGRAEVDDLVDSLARAPRDATEAAHGAEVFGRDHASPQYKARGGGFRQPRRKPRALEAPDSNGVISVSISKSESTPHLVAPGFLKPKTQEPDEMFFPKID